MTRPSASGRIEVICGCMFSGKTEELIRRMRQVNIARQPFRIFSPPPRYPLRQQQDYQPHWNLTGSLSD